MIRARERQATDEQAHREADSAQCCHPVDLGPPCTGWLRSESQPHGGPDDSEDPDLLAQKQTECDPDRERSKNVCPAEPAEMHTRIREGKDGNYHQTHPRIDRVFQTTQRRLACLSRCTCRNHHRDHDARQCRMDTGAIDAEPERDTDREIGKEVNDAAAIEREQHHDADGRQTEIRKIEVAGIEEGDDRNRAEVVEDGDTCQQDLEGTWNARSEQREDAEREGDIGRRGNCPAIGDAVAAVRDGEKDEGGQGHPTSRRYAGQDATSPRGEFAADHLALDLQANEEKEDRHQTIVDPVLDGEAGDVEIEGVFIEREQGGVRDEQRQHRRDDEQDAGRGFTFEEAREHVVLFMH